VLNEVIYGTSRHCPQGNCVEAAALPDGAVAVRDSKDRNKPPHIFTAEEWAAFIAGVKDGDFDFLQHQATSQPPRERVSTEKATA
jgi:hypothetical protein